MSVVICSASAHADSVIGLYAGADAWRASTTGGFANTTRLSTFEFADTTQPGYFIALEHFIPLLPNIRLQHMSLATEGQTRLNESFVFADTPFAAGSRLQASFDVTSTDYILYYEIFDNPLFSFDAGVSAKQLKGDISASSGSLRGAQTLNEWIPMLYVDSKIALFTTGFDLFATGSATRYDGSHLYDVQAGFAYRLMDNALVDMRVKLGYRSLDIQLDDVSSLYADLQFKGVFAGVDIHF
ncbi:TIGR04219 family outer membrane beta-barrel protein [Alishewanella tabrizica]|uniref:Outer membrane protein n=1 Tax=Alishewanella tabrizica TaxID=671278 RepID=A0ABQ2WQ82_9ALTE|nr:TIGR04219 family outer membrane beta-barrel protein [Alishewanella tabrizica]GGW64775.1 hypothetical protein GCM10008111_20870 [Alishewanella tabrizica]